MTAINAASFNSTSLNSTATTAAILYQRNATNVLNATPSTGVNLGTLTTNQTQLDAVGQVSVTNASDYYNFALQGTSLKLDLSNITNSADLRVQITDSQGNVVADNQGTISQKTAYLEATVGSAGLTTSAGKYTVQVTYAPNTSKSQPQSYSLSLYSGNSFSAAYQTTVASQLSPTTYVPIDNTQTFQTSDANLYTRSGYNQIGVKPAGAINIGWLSENQSSLAVTSQLTSADSADYYSFTLQQGSNLKMAFNDTTNLTSTPQARVQIYDSTGTVLLADSEGDTQMQAAYASLTSSTGLTAKPGDYLAKIGYAGNANKSTTQTYNFQLYSGDSFANQYTTTASAQTYGNAVLTGNPNVVGYSPLGAAATSIANLVNGYNNGTTAADTLFSALSAFV